MSDAARRLDTTDYYPTGKCCSCENPSVKFEAKGGTIFEFCIHHGSLVKKAISNGRR